MRFKNPLRRAAGRGPLGNQSGLSDAFCPPAYATETG